MAVCSAAVPEVTASAYLVRMRAANSFSKVSTFMGGFEPEPYQRNGRPRLEHLHQLGALLFVVVLRPEVVGAERRCPDRLVLGGSGCARHGGGGEEVSAIDHVGLLITNSICRLARQNKAGAGAPGSRPDPFSVDWGHERVRFELESPARLRTMSCRRGSNPVDLR